MSNNDLGTLASSKRELTFIRYLAALGAIVGGNIGYEFYLGSGDTLPILAGVLIGAIAGALCAKALSIAIQIALMALIVLYYANRIFNIWALITS
ncbi:MULTISPECIES: hypothetical protein [Aliiglaciecola]|uniref:hypothetical protein n=1 Tax=Aliiglaciecola TaxID=1406885 RepID=UPI001C08B238|nr:MULTISPECIES: hypothetical protein [Aliiglaciecola]MBU2878260.1 hypothetical protein [Aliiglaciecola lipolytica]MDO6711828.1 hypothetical protein [Aliiglaciecola sp. 2_MG-2023]MDO6752998.1 hypothetical protein [Aliiglaciecola sp. 1_MG-2023]